MVAEMAHDFSSGQSDSRDPSVQFLTFAVDKNEYAVDIMKVREIRGWHDTTRIPNSPEYMMGVINLRGTVIPIFDLRNRFSQGKTTPNEKNVVVVLAVGSRTIGILVDAVSDILTVNRSEIKQAPSASKETGIDDAYVSGLISVDEKMVILLDVEYLFDRSILEQAESSAA
jgi:purine-binding chemotaxis protein CheW